MHASPMDDAHAEGSHAATADAPQDAMSAMACHMDAANDPTIGHFALPDSQMPSALAAPIPHVEVDASLPDAALRLTYLPMHYPPPAPPPRRAA